MADRGAHQPSPPLIPAPWPLIPDPLFTGSSIIPPWFRAAIHDGGRCSFWAPAALLFFALLGALQAFNTSNVRFLNPETAGETLAFTGLTVVVFLLLLVLLILLLRNILKLYADQSSSALGARLRTRMVLGAVLIALTPAVFMFLFSFELMNRSIDRWFSPNTSELREDSNRVVLELAQYVTNNARVEAESIAAFGAPDQNSAGLQDELAHPPHHPRRRIRRRLRQRPAGPRQLSGSTGIKPGKPASVAQ